MMCQLLLREEYWERRSELIYYTKQDVRPEIAATPLSIGGAFLG
ncbi:hypothetical protein QUB30_25690 [Microcoleus sp. BROC3]